MTRTELIAHYKWVVNAVFQAEDAIKSKWVGRLAEARFADQETREKVADEYFEAIATEIVSKTSDEQIAEMEE